MVERFIICVFIIENIILCKEVNFDSLFKIFNWKRVFKIFRFCGFLFFLMRKLI